MSLYLTVAVPTPLRRTFEYLPPKDSDAPAQAGARVLVPYGKQTLVGVVLKTHTSATYTPGKLRHAYEMIDETPILSEDILSLCHWTADYYLHPLGEVIHAALPVELRKNTKAQYPNTPYWEHTTEGKGLPEDGLKRSKKQQKLHQLLLKYGKLSNDELKSHDISSTVARALEAKNLIRRSTQTTYIEQTHNNPILLLNEVGKAPTKGQELALAALRYHQYNTYLLEGITGSGKTEIYLQAIARVLSEGKQALVLVPEIGLTPQTLQRFKKRFAVATVELHSNVAQKQRTANWMKAASGEARIIIGTRLAIFTPLPKLGIIIIDEEHDPSFKQQDGLRYSARDLAVIRAHKGQIPLILGTATPSLESLHNALHKRYTHLRLTQRAGQASNPDVQCVDMRNTPKNGAFSIPTLEHMQATLARGEQVLVFLNRRGFAPALLCECCGWAAACKSCDARMTLHTNPKHLRCHHCNAQKPTPKHCPECHNTELNAVGLGTARIEDFLSATFTSTEVIRVDQDSMQRKNAMAELTEKLHLGEPCLLVGTQMLAKGHHFPKVTLVVLLDVDQSLFSGDFRALERLGQQFTQVAGRAGREDRQGTVLLQTYQVDHPLLALLLEQGYHNYAQTLLNSREASRLPPVWHMALLRAESKYAANAIQFLQMAAQTLSETLPPAPTHTLLGPLPSLLEKRQDRFRYQLQITCAHRQTLRAVLPRWIAELEKHNLSRKVRWSIDVDPVDTA